MLHPELTVATRPLAAPENQVFYNNLRVTVLEDRLFRLETVPFTDEATQTIWFRDHAPVAFSSRVHNGRLWIQTEALTLEVHAEDLRSSLVHFADGEVSDLYDRDNLLGTLCTLDTNGEHLRLWPEVRQYDRTHIPLEKGVLSRRALPYMTIASGCCYIRMAGYLLVPVRAWICMFLRLAMTIMARCAHYTDFAGARRLCRVGAWQLVEPLLAIHATGISGVDGRFCGGQHSDGGRRYRYGLALCGY